MKLLKILGKKQESFQKENEYLADIEAKKIMLNRRADLIADPRAKYQGPIVGATGG